jgi:hypothetical protein
MLIYIENLELYIENFSKPVLMHVRFSFFPINDACYYQNVEQSANLNFSTNKHLDWIDMNRIEGRKRKDYNIFAHRF